MDLKLVSSLFALGAIATPLIGQIELTENLVVTGFIDMSASKISDDDIDNDDVYAGLDQVELDFLYSYDAVSAQVDINYVGGDYDEVSLEQAFVTYTFGDSGFSITGGKFLSYMGWETAEPTGLYQYSYAYDVGGIIPGYHNGIKVDYAAEMFSVGVALLDDLAINRTTKIFDTDDFGFEIYVKATPVEGLTLFAGYALDEDEGVSGDSFDLINLWASYEFGITTLAVEFNIFDYYGDEGKSGLIMANFAITEKFGITLRASMEDWDEVGGDFGGTYDNMKFTISPGYAVTDNLFILAEVSVTDWDQDGWDETKLYAVEALFTF